MEMRMKQNNSGMFAVFSFIVLKGTL